MVWSDEPTEAQLGVIFHWFKWKMPTAKAQDAVHWLQDTATRKEVSCEMTRLKKLYDSHQLDEKKCFDSEIWEGYDMRGGDYE